MKMSTIPTLLGPDGMTSLREYAGYHGGGSGFGGQLRAWNPPGESVDAALLPNFTRGNARADDLVRNNGYAANAIQLHQDHIVGSFFRLSHRPSWRYLGIGEEEARAFSREVESAWKEFAEDDCCCIDVERKRTFTMMIREGVAMHAFNGELFVQATWDTSPSRLFRTQFRMVSPKRISNPNNTGDSRNCRAGVQINDSGAALGYYVSEDGYPNTALVGVQVDSEQFGSQQVSRNYHLRGRILQVPSNYNPQTRQYSGIWDGTFKPAYSNNMAWCLWDMLTHPRYGMGKRLGAADVDKWALYVIGQCCDQSVPDGFGGTEPRITCNAWLTTQRKAWDVLSDFCSAMRCMPVWNGQTLTFVQDRPSDKVWTYNRSNVVMPDDGAPFRYSFSALKDRHNAVEVNWIDPDNGWETATELVEDTQAIARYGRNVTKMDAFGCTRRGQAHRAGLWLIKTELLETQTVDFSVGAEGLRHVPGDVIEICDDDYAGISIGGRVLAVNSQTRTLTLDREITLPSSGTTLISLVDGQGNPVSVEVQSVTDGVKVKVSRVPDGVAEYSVWGLKLPTLRQRLFRCVSIRENDDGTYAITAVQHVPEKEAIVDNGAHFDGDQSGTVNGVTPPAVQHLTAEVTADSGEYQVLARWDTPKVVKGVSFMLRLTVAADDGSERLVSTARTTETTYRFTQLALGNYRLTVRAVNAWGQPVHIPIR
ncbi:tail component of prophage [Escherichia coli]|nr:tail component of prophage [Escherichia coli]